MHRGGREDRTLSSVSGQFIDYEAAGQPMRGYFAADPAISGPRPGVLVLPEWWGMNDYVQRRARELAELGYAALAADVYGEGRTADNPNDAGALMGNLLGDRAAVDARLVAALATLRAQAGVDADRCAAIGYCLGGALALHMARTGADLAGVVSFHGSLSSMHKPAPGEVRAKVLVCHGEADDFIPPEDIDNLKQEMADAGADLRFTVYPGAKHGFTNPDADANAEKFGIGLAYDPEVDAKSWAAMRAFFDEIF